MSDEDLQNIGARRRPSNKLGFALQLCVLRDPGSCSPQPLATFAYNLAHGVRPTPRRLLQALKDLEGRRTSHGGRVGLAVELMMLWARYCAVYVAGEDRGEGIDRDAAGKCRRATHPGGRQARQSAGEVSRTAAGCAARAQPSRTSAQRTGLCTMRRRVTAPGSGTRRSGRRLGAPTDDGCGCFVCAWEADICDACEDNPCACEATT